MATRSKKPKTVAQKKISKVMREFKQGKLHSGSSQGPIVKNHDQAIAIALSESRKATATAKKNAAEAKELKSVAARKRTTHY